MLQLLYPPCCPICGESTPCSDGNRFCPGCDPLTITGGGSRQAAGSFCPPGLDTLQWVARYRRDSPLTRAVLNLKHGGKDDLALWLGTLMALEFRKTVGVEAQVILPVPLHWTRTLRRGYNQAALLGVALGRHIGLPVSGRYLRRCRRTIPQRGPASARWRNVRLAFATRHNPGDLRGALLVDDVVTSGATLAGCASLLKQAGVSEVHGMVVLRA